MCELGVHGRIPMRLPQLGPLSSCHLAPIDMDTRRITGDLVGFTVG